MRPDILEFKRICGRLLEEVRRHNSALTDEECNTVIECVRHLETIVRPSPKEDDDQPLGSPLGALLPPNID